MDGQVFTKETKELMVKAIDEALVLPFYLEVFDGVTAKILINFIDKQGDKFIPDSIDKTLNVAVTKAFNDDFDGASEDLGTVLNVLIDIPLVSEEDEQQLFVDGTKFIVRLIKQWVNHMKNKKHEE